MAVATEPFANRRMALKERWSGGDALALVPGMSLCYLTGVRKAPTERPLIWLWAPSGRMAWIAPELERPGLEEAAGRDAELFTYADGQDPQRAADAWARAWGLRGGRVLVEATSMRFLEAGLLRQAGAEVVGGGGDAVAALRTCKDAGEIARLREAVAMAETALEAGVRAMRPGVSEAEVARVITLEAMRLGSEPFWKEIVVASGPRAASPHTRTGQRRLEIGDTVVIDAGAVVSGYVSDITRTFFIREASPAWRERYAAVLAANRAAVAAVRPGAAMGAVDAAAREHLRQAGLGEYFIHRVGHGIGLEGHEGPYLVPGSQEPLPPGAVVTIEPGVYLPGDGGVRIEDDVVCTPDGPDVLTAFDRTLRIV
jgi:Xaa-Pro dipeptidase